MLKYILIAALATAFSFFFAGIASNIPVSPSWLWRCGTGREIRYRFYLGCALFITLCYSGIVAAIGGYVFIFVPSFVFALIGAVMAMFCVSPIRKIFADRFGNFRPHGGGNCEYPIGSGEENCENDQSANGVERAFFEENTFENDAKSTTNSKIVTKKVGVLSLIAEKSRTKVIVWCAIFAVSLVIFSVFYAFSDNSRFYSENGGIVEKTVVFETVDKNGGAVCFNADGGADTYAVIAYGAEIGAVEALADVVNGEKEFTVRYAIIDQGEWSGYYLLLDVKDGDGVSYLDENEVLGARAEARTGKLFLFGTAVGLCGGIFFFYAAITVYDKRRSCRRDEISNSNER